MQDQEKIEIVHVSEKIYSHRGFSNKGCYNSSCMDNCCRQGCDVDKVSYDIIMAHKDDVEKMLGFDIEKCFEQEWSGQTDFLGRNSISSTIINGTCAFHLARGKGCVLWQKMLTDNCLWRMIPSTCRLYPLTWDNGTIKLINNIEQECNCLDPLNSGLMNLWETQRDAIEDIFLIRHPMQNCIEQ